MHSYSVPVALFDFVPVLATALALALIARAIAHRHHGLQTVAWTAAVIIPLGGLCKATWKLLIALGNPPIAWLENLLFILLAPGFVAMAFSLYHARIAWRSGTPPSATHFSSLRLGLWVSVPLLGSVIATQLYPDTRVWFFWLLGITTCANICLLAQAVIAARWGGLAWPVSAYFVYNFVATLALSGLARMPPGENTAWLQEMVNLSAQFALALGFWHLARRMRAPTRLDT